MDRFDIEAVDLGQVFKIYIRHDNSMIGADWYLDQVEVLDVETEEVYMFLCERWLSTKKEDKQIDRIFYVKVSRNAILAPTFCGKQVSASIFVFVFFRAMKVNGILISISKRFPKPSKDWTKTPIRKKRRKRWRWLTRVQVRVQTNSLLELQQTLLPKKNVQDLRDKTM